MNDWVKQFVAEMEKADAGKGPFRGVPKNVMLDPGSANTSTAFKNLCKALGVQAQINETNQRISAGAME